jgi:hypothetical protein
LASRSTAGTSARLFGDRAFYNGDWLLRAAAARAGIYGNDAVEAMYPMTKTLADGTPLDGSKHKYTLTFAKDQFPPVNAFWSVTMYDGKTQLLIKNPINRYLINSPMLSGMKKNKDGSLTLYIQKDSPGKEPTGCRRKPNWLPDPAPARPPIYAPRGSGDAPANFTGRQKPPDGPNAMAVVILPDYGQTPRSRWCWPRTRASPGAGSSTPRRTNCAPSTMWPAGSFLSPGRRCRLEGPGREASRTIFRLISSFVGLIPAWDGHKLLWIQEFWQTAGAVCRSRAARLFVERLHRALERDQQRSALAVRRGGCSAQPGGAFRW